MRILGIDPGSKITGFGLLEVGQEISILDFGQIRPKTNASYSQKLHTIFDGVESLIHKFRPTCLAVETQFVKDNVKAAMHLGMVRGVVMTAASRASLEIFEYAPKKIKKAVCHGNASKQSIQKMIQLLFDLDEIPTPEDAADALAIAYTHAKQQNIVNLVHFR